MGAANLTSQADSIPYQSSKRMLVIGEILWDLFPDGKLLGGAPLNFAAHISRLGYEPLLISAVGDDDLGRRAQLEIQALGLDTSMLQVAAEWETGTARVTLDLSGHPTFEIPRPAAYDAAEITQADQLRLSAWAPAWVYYGTLFASRAEGKRTLLQLLAAVPDALRFYDVNLRPGFDSPALVIELLSLASVVKLNEAEFQAVSGFGSLPSDVEAFCRAGVARYGWKAVCVTLGARGCAVLWDNEYLVADGYPVTVADSVGAGDAFAAAFVHGLSCHWGSKRTAAFANRVGAIVASRAGAIPDWSIAEATGP
jgi:fructokinase